MISGTKSSEPRAPGRTSRVWQRGTTLCGRLTLGLLLALTSLATLSDDETRALTVHDVLGALSTVPERRDCFQEKRYSALLKEPLTSTGVLEFRSPSFLEKRTLAPDLEFFSANHEIVTVRNARTTKTRELKLTSYPPLQALVTAFRATLAGDVAAMDKSFETSIKGTAAAWTLTMIPKTSLKKILTRVEVDGTGAAVMRFTVHENGGDVSITEIVPCPEAP